MPPSDGVRSTIRRRSWSLREGFEDTFDRDKILTQRLTSVETTPLPSHLCKASRIGHNYISRPGLSADAASVLMILLKMQTLDIQSAPARERVSLPFMSRGTLDIVSSSQRSLQSK